MSAHVGEVCEGLRVEAKTKSKRSNVEGKDRRRLIRKVIETTGGPHSVLFLCRRKSGEDECLGVEASVRRSGGRVRGVQLRPETEPRW